MPIERIENKTLRQKVYEKFCESIINGEMLPGQTFSLRELAEKMGVSIMPVREALWQLESEKVIIIENNKKMFINTLNRNELNDLFEVRLFLETELMERACDKQDNISISYLDEICKEMERTFNDTRTFLKLNKEFHFSIYKAADSPVYLGIVKNLWLRQAPYFIKQNENSNYDIKVKQHLKILQALKQGKKKELREALRKDMESALQAILSDK